MQSYFAKRFIETVLTPLIELLVELKQKQNSLTNEVELFQ
jgi:hypothetical protein